MVAGRNKIVRTHYVLRSEQLIYRMKGESFDLHVVL